MAREQIHETDRNLAQGARAHQSSADSGLVRDHDHREPKPAERAHDRDDAVEEAELGPGGNVAVPDALVDHAIAIEENGGAMSTSSGQVEVQSDWYKRSAQGQPLRTRHKPLTWLSLSERPAFDGEAAR